MSQTLYLKWRPHLWDEVIGQEHIVTTLHNAVAADRVSHAMLFAGPRGTGKTTTARILAKAVNCLDPDPARRPCEKCEYCKAINTGRFLDLIEIDAASNTSVDDVRNLRDKINFTPNQGRYKVYIIDEVHMLSTAAFNAILKTLEEPPSHAIFVLATTEIHKIPATVLSRCQRHEFRRIPVTALVEQLRHIATEEKFSVEADVLNLIAHQATGSMRDAISLLDQLTSASETVTLELAGNVLGTVASQSVLDLVEALVQRDAAKGLDHIHKTLDAGGDPRLFGRQIVDYLRDMLLSQTGNADQVDTPVEVQSQIARHNQSVPLEELLKIIHAFNKATNETRNTWQPALPLEMAFIESLSELSENQPENKNHSQDQETRLTVESGGEHKVPNELSDIPLTTIEIGDSPAETVLSIQAINEQWRKFLNLVGQQSKQTQALLNSCKPYGIKGLTLYLGFKGDFAKTKLERKENLDLTEQTLASVYEVPLKVKCFLVTGQQGGLPPDVDSNGMVATALRDLGGEIVDVQ
jgi:DNA polymerase-3 subunit gamma/tau